MYQSHHERMRKLLADFLALTPSFLLSMKLATCELGNKKVQEDWRLSSG